MINYKQRPRLRKVHASIRNTWLLFRQFQWPLIAFMLAIIGGGWIYFYLSDQAGQPIASRSEAMYHVLGLTFLNPIEEFPAFWYLQIFYFLMPVIGIGFIGAAHVEALRRLPGIEVAAIAHSSDEKAKAKGGKK